MSDKSSDKVDQIDPTKGSDPVLEDPSSLEDVVLTRTGVMKSVCSYLNLADTISFVSCTKKLYTEYKDDTLIWRRHARLKTHIEHHLTSFNIN
jgi:hypothetical protein